MPTRWKSERKYEAQKDGLPTKPLTDKVYEGIAKNIEEDVIVQAVTRVRNRYRHAYRQAQELAVDPEQEELLGNLIAGAYTAGLTEEDCDAILAALQTRTRTANQRQDQELAIQTMTTARFMAHREVRSKTVSELLVTALDKSYETADLKEMQHSFLNRARYGSAENIARQFSDNINQGMDASALGHSPKRSGESDGSGGAGSGGSNGSGGNSGGAGSGGSNSSGGNSGGAGSGGSNSSDGNSGGSGSSGGSGGSSGSGSGGSGQFRWWSWKVVDPSIMYLRRTFGTSRRLTIRSNSELLIVKKYHNLQELFMKKLFALIFALTLFVGVAASPLWAAGGKNHGSLGEGSVDQEIPAATWQSTG